MQFVSNNSTSNYNVYAIKDPITLVLCLLGTSIILPTIGYINFRALRGQKPIADKSKYLNIPFSFLATLAGIIDGDGYIAITRTAKGYIGILLTISLDIRDEPMLRHICDTLGFGRIAGPYLNKDGSKTIKLIFSRTELQELLFPLFAHHRIFFLTTVRRAQFDLAMWVMLNSITKFDLIPTLIPISVQPLPLLAAGYLELSFFMY